MRPTMSSGERKRDCAIAFIALYKGPGGGWRTASSEITAAGSHWSLARVAAQNRPQITGPLSKIG
jgi:hypothetical protein